MIVVADATPINYLVLLGQIDLLRQQYGTVLLPPIVLAELVNHKTPHEVRAWIESEPRWMIHAASPKPVQEPIIGLDGGETEAIALALQLHADWLIIDETAGRAEARRRGIPSVGTVGILTKAHAAGFVDLPEVLQRLQGLGFYISESFMKSTLKSAGF